MDRSRRPKSPPARSALRTYRGGLDALPGRARSVLFTAGPTVLETTTDLPACKAVHMDYCGVTVHHAAIGMWRCVMWRCMLRAVRTGFDSQAVGIGALALLLAVALGAAAGITAGAAAGVLAALAGLLASAVLSVAMKRRSRNAAWEEHRQDLLEVFAPPLLAGSKDRGEQAGLAVARYLRPEEEVVPFRVRSELGDLLTWCGTAEHVAARLVTGDGGAGKTRLALRLSQELVADGWQPLWVPRGRERLVGSAVQELGRPCVVLVDYAETRDGLGGLLTDVAGASGGPDVRVVMLARSSGEWWQRLVTGGDNRVAKLLGASPVVLGPIAAEGGQGELFGEALTALRRSWEWIARMYRWS